MGRPLIKYGSYGPDVLLVQECLRCKPMDSDFGSITEEAVENFQGDQGLEIDGIVGSDTWAALEEVYQLPPYPPPIFPTLTDAQLEMIYTIAEQSPIAGYSWKDRGQAPIGYIKGMAVAFSTVFRKWQAGDSSAKEMAKADTYDDDKDALSWYRSNFQNLGMSNEEAGADTLRHLFVLLLGLGMRESSGQHCEGRDQSADNVSSDTAEAGLFQQSWNSSTCSTEIPKLYDVYAPGGMNGDEPLCALSTFEEEVSCSSSDWQSYGSGKGYHYQTLAKHCPQFAVEMCGIGLRNLRQHWGPINRKEAEILTASDQMFHVVQRLLQEIDRTPVA